MKSSSQLLAVSRQSRMNRKSLSGEMVDRIWSKEKFAEFIRLRFPSCADAHLAAVTGIPMTTVKKHVTGETKPGADHVLRYLELFGPELLIAVMSEAPAWAERSARHEQLRQLKVQRSEIDQQIAEYPAG